MISSKITRYQKKIIFIFIAACFVYLIFFHSFLGTIEEPSKNLLRTFKGPSVDDLYKDFYKELDVINNMISQINLANGLSPKNKIAIYNDTIDNDIIKDDKQYMFRVPFKGGLRDYQHYTCSNMIRVGGSATHKNAAPDPLYRIDGAWYVCLDGNFKITKNKCKVFSFGVNNDPTFEHEIQKLYGCQVDSFDPFIEADEFKKVRASDINLKNAYTLNINENWNFHRIGIVGTSDKKEKREKMRMATFDDILDLTQSREKVIDIFKIDIEGEEFSIIPTMDMDYACKYFKQLLIETHIYNDHPVIPKPTPEIEAHYEILKRLEQCFLLFHRDTRFFSNGQDIFRNGQALDGKTGALTEFQRKSPIYPSYFGNDGVTMIKFMLSHGELYYINKNFLNETDF